MLVLGTVAVSSTCHLYWLIFDYKGMTINVFTVVHSKYLDFFQSTMEPLYKKRVRTSDIISDRFSI